MMKKSLRILVAEDSPVMRMTLKAVLMSKGYDFNMVEDGALALNLLESGEEFDIILTDHHMPHLKGLDLLRAIKADESLKGVPVILHSSEVAVPEFASGVIRLGGIPAIKGTLASLEAALQVAEDVLKHSES